LVTCSRRVYSNTALDKLKSFTVGLTDQSPTKEHGPLEAPFQTCASHEGQLTSGEIVELTCTHLLYACGRFLFVAAKAAYGMLNLCEVEVFSGTLSL